MAGLVRGVVEGVLYACAGEGAVFGEDDDAGGAGYVAFHHVLVGEFGVRDFFGDDILMDQKTVGKVRVHWSLEEL